MKKQDQRLFTASFIYGILLTGWVTLFATPTIAQFETVPHPMDKFLTNILNFKKPTGIRGTLRYIDLESTIIWLNWHERSDDRPLFQTQWRPVPGDATLAVHPQDLDQFKEFEQFSKGSPLEMIIQIDPDGKRRILSYHDLTQPPKIPM